MEAGLPEGRVQRGAGIRPHRGQGAGRAHGRRLHRLHRLDAPPARRCMEYAGAVEPQEGLARVRRQVAEHRARPTAPDLDRAATAAAYAHLLQPGRDVLGRLAPAGAGVRSRTRCSRRSRPWAATMKPGDPLDPATKLGAIVDETQMQHACSSYIEAGKSEGARVALGGSRVRAGQRRILRRAHGVRRREARDAHRARGNLRAGAGDDHVQRRRGGDPDRQRRGLRPRGRGVDPRHQRPRIARRARCAPARST